MVYTIYTKSGISRPLNATVNVGVSQPLSETVISECFATLSASVTARERFCSLPHVFTSEDMLLTIGFYEIDESYIDYLSQFALHLFHNKQAGQQNKRKYIGILFSVNGHDYFAPLSSFKPKHVKMKESLDFLKIGNYAVINLNNMFPATRKYCKFVDFSKESNPQYKKLLESEYRIIKISHDKI